MKIEITIDPLKKFTEHSEEEIFETLGLLPNWVIHKDYFDKDLKTALDMQYCCGMYKSEHVSISETGVYKYEDSDSIEEFSPLIKINRGEEIFYQYQYGIVAIINENNESFATRMD